MAKLALTFTLLFFFFASSYARTWLLPDIEPTLLLPSQTQHSQTTDLKQVDNSKTLQIQPKSEIVSVNSIRPAFVSFQPSNHHFRGKREFFGSRIPLRRCRHGHHINPRFHSYGNDMLMAADFDQMMVRGDMRQIPARFHRHHHLFAKDKFKRAFSNDEEREEGSLMKRFRKFLTHF